jgi:ArsR family transcriptional regulator, arsenate/arsenite/antimonite-responsive transcriptional repressor
MEILMAVDCCNFFKALLDKTRQKILELLYKNKEMCVSEICKHFKMKQPSISHHLNILKQAGLVMSRKEGKEIYYSLNCTCMADGCKEFFGRFNIVNKE